jgi:Zn-dependent M28 family amino/carboxypeptidase
MERSAVESITASGFLQQLQRIVEIKDGNGTVSRSFEEDGATHAAQAFLQKEFESMGLKSCFYGPPGRGSISAFSMANVVAVIPGTGEGSLTVGAHYDSIPDHGSAPGAEDNGSGLAAMLLMARALARQGLKPRRTLYFVGFSAEEAGSLGSDFLAEELKKGTPVPEECGAPASDRAGVSFLQGGSFVRDSKKKGGSGHEVIVLDEVGWLTPKYDKATVNLESYDWAASVMDQMACASRRHNGNALEVVHNSNPLGSDHVSFLERGMKAVLVINGDDEAYPNYHQSTDTIDNVNPEFAVKITKMVMGAVMRLAGQ